MVQNRIANSSIGGLTPSGASGLWRIESALPNDLAQELFGAWLQRLGEERLGSSGVSSDANGQQTVTLGDPQGAHFRVTISGSEGSVVESIDLAEGVVAGIVKDALAKVARADFGEERVYETQMSIGDPQDFNLTWGTHFMRLLGDQVHVEGHRRLHTDVLLDFQEGLLVGVPSEGLVLAPPSTVTVTLFMPSPVIGRLSQRSVSAAFDTVAAICAFATGRPVNYQCPHFPTERADPKMLERRRRDPAIMNLARDSISLDIFGDLSFVGGPEAAVRARRALSAYHAALRQANPEVAVILLVSSMEAIVTPLAPWGRAGVTARFIEAIMELCPEKVDELSAHGNVEYAFGYKKKGGIQRQRRDLLSLVYSARSSPAHSGLSPATSGLFGMPTAASIQMALISDLARAAILSYIRAPRSWLIGYPNRGRSDELNGPILDLNWLLATEPILKGLGL